MSKQFRKINWDKKLAKKAVKDYNKLAVFYADVSLSRDAWEKWSDMWEKKYYKLLKQNKKLKKELKAKDAYFDEVDSSVQSTKIVYGGPFIDASGEVTNEC
jgi:hypothetical protein